MTTRAEQKQRRIQTGSVAGLLALAVASLSESARLIGLDRGWFAHDSGIERALTVGWVAGMALMAILFVALWWLGRRLTAAERAVLGDEFAVHLSRSNAVAALVATFLVAAVISAFPALELPGRAVALIVVAAAGASLAIAQVVRR